VRRRDIRVGAAVIGLVMGTMPIANPSTTFAFGPAGLPPPQLDANVVKPRLKPPPVAAPHAINLPNPTTAQLLFAKKELQVPQRLRLMVFAPHPDDETLGGGGLIQRVLAQGGTVRIVFVTNGDGYVDGVRHEVKRAHTSTSDFIKYGKRRHDEAVRALEHLGLQTSDAVFLGFPDDGIDDLWAGHWSTRRPYTSPYTHSDHPPYKESLSRQVEYAGTDLDREIERTLRNFAPDWVLMPDPRDRHPDHCTTGVFVLDALRRLRHEGQGVLARTQVLTYLVHYPDYPASPAWVREIEGAGVGGSPTAGKVLAAAHWVNLPLYSGELAGKRSAISEYQSQLQVMNPFLRQFLGPFELFGQLDAAQVVAVPAKYAARFRRTR
jgi:LmbE family N-acetylglucosaminyl deacetylase